MNFEMTPEKTKDAAILLADTILVTDLVMKWVQSGKLQMDTLTHAIRVMHGVALFMTNLMKFDTLPTEDRLHVKSVSGQIAESVSFVLREVFNVLQGIEDETERETTFNVDDLAFLGAYNLKMSFFFMEFEAWFIDVYLPTVENQLAVVPGSDAVN